MEIQSLRLLVTEEDLNDLVARLFTQLEKVRDVRVHLLPEGISVTGTYLTVIRLSFDTLWQIFVHEGKLAVRLEKLKAAGLGAGLLKQYLVDAIASKISAVELERDTLLLDLDHWFEQKGLRLRTNLKSVRCSYGNLLIESGRDEFDSPSPGRFVSADRV